MIYLGSVRPSAKLKHRDFPFSVPAIRSLPELNFDAPVTFFAGGNGTGKSTLLEALAAATNRIVVGDGGITASTRALADTLTVSWKRKTQRGFFLRAEDFLAYKRGLVSDVADLRRTADRFGNEIEEGYGLQLAQAAARGQANALARRYGEDLDAMSHGESFLQFFRARFTGEGLYLLDEPDTALSAQSVLGLVSALVSMTANEKAQFIIATHNPILLAMPDAQLINFDREPIGPTSWDDLEQVQLLRDFLSHPGVYMRRLGP